MLVKLFLLSFVFFSMLIDDNHSVQAQNEVLRFCRTTGCDTRTLQEVFDQCRRVYGSNTIRREQCDGGRFRHTCCTRQPRFVVKNSVNNLSESRDELVVNHALNIDAVQGPDPFQKMATAFGRIGWFA
uniref:Uncharacterized protein n=1 Tax=Tetranychus urticae TaxID=32264 RepID=T1KLP5_TETUR